MDLTPEDYRRASEAVVDALAVPVGEREAFLSEVLGNREELVSYALQILEASEGAATGFAEPPSAFGQLQERASDGPESLAEAVAKHEIVIEEELGDGAMGVVYRGRQGVMARPVAVKALRGSLVKRMGGVERFLREIQATAALDHPGIVRVYADGGSESPYWFAMELVEGQSLDEELELHRQVANGAESGEVLLGELAGPERPMAVAQLVLDLCLALEHAHKRGVVHRDIKPSNVLIATSGQPKIVDFGVAKFVEAGTLTGSDQIVGSLPYMSPEQARVQTADVDARTDVYSLGAVMYEALTLQRAVLGETSHEILTKIQHESPMPIAKLYRDAPRDLARICTKAMSKQAVHRYESAAAMASDLQKFLAGESLDVVLEPWTQSAKRALARHRTLVTTLAVLLAAAVGASLAWRAYSTLAHPTARLFIDGPSAWSATLKMVSAETSMPESERVLGRLSGGPWEVPVGMIRVVVDSGDDAARQSWSRWVYGGDDLHLATDAAGSSGPSGAGMVRIEGGTLRVERPKISPLFGRAVEVEPFLLDECEVSVGQYRTFLRAHPDVSPPAGWGLLEGATLDDDLPASGMTWEAAAAYASWVGKRLPTHAEWMWAARGEALRSLPWSPATDVRGVLAKQFAPDPRPGSAARGLLTSYLRAVAPVRSYPEARTPSGLYHMLGNVGEWTESVMVEVAAAGALRPEPAFRVFCGGYWGVDPTVQTLSEFGRSEAGASGHSMAIGFRCAADIPRSR